MVLLLSGSGLAQRVQADRRQYFEELAAQARVDSRKMFEMLARAQVRETYDYCTTVAELRSDFGPNPHRRRDLAFELGDFVEADRQNELCKTRIGPARIDERTRTILDLYQELIRAERSAYVIDWNRFKQTHTEELTPTEFCRR